VLITFAYHRFDDEFGVKGRDVMVGFHSTVGTLVLLAYLVLVVVNVLALRGQAYPWARQLSFFAAGLLVLQYVIGCSLLGSDHDVSAAHYILALCALITVGFEHGYANTRETPVERARFAALATAGTFIIVLVTYIIGQSN
jgi:heme A synthase